MAGLLAVLGALARVSIRDLRSLNSLVANNFFVVAILLLNQSGPFLKLLMGFLLLFPLSADPLSKVPPERILDWPFSRLQRILLRIGSIALSPATWLAIVLIFFSSPTLFVPFIAAIVLIQTARAWSLHRPKFHPLIFIPATTLITKNLRQLLLHLDTWLALLLTLCGLFYRNPDALVILAVLVVLALSTPAQCLFSLDLPGGFTRYQLMPLSSLRILASKDAAFLILAAVLTLPLAPLPGIAASLAALTFGHHFSTLHPLPQQPWRFTSGIALLPGLAQSAALAASAIATHRIGPHFLVLPALAYSVSLFSYSRKL